MAKKRKEFDLSRLGVLSKRQTLAINYMSVAFGLSGKDILKAIKDYAKDNKIPLNNE